MINLRRMSHTPETKRPSMTLIKRQPARHGNGKGHDTSGIAAARGSSGAALNLAGAEADTRDADFVRT
jgi:hypothetical protein